MATTINGTVFTAQMPNTKNARPFWDRMKSSASDALTAAKCGTRQIIPAIAKGADVTLRTVDGACTKANKAAVDFLVKYPGIAMTLSPQTIVRMAVAEHYKEMASQPEADGPDLSDAFDVAQHVSVNIMQ